jgi:hypothetical protein
MDRAALALLGAGVDVAQPSLERVVIEHRGRAGGGFEALRLHPKVTVMPPWRRG